MKNLATALDINKCEMRSKANGWAVPMIRKGRHAYFEWPVYVRCTETELRKVHRHFNHPEPHRILAVIKRGVPDKATAQDLEPVEKISRSCHVCQCHAEASRFLRVSLSN